MELEQMLTDRQIKDFDHLVQTSKGRKYLIEAISVEHESNWQCVSTPYDIASEMLDLIPKDADTYIVFFALEFLEVLVKERGFDAEKILFVADNQIESDFANFYGCLAVIITKNTTINKETLNEIVNGAGMKFGTLAVVGNPPYNANSNGKDSIPLYHLFTESVIDALNPDYFSFIIPSRWMVGGKGLDKHRTRMMNDRHMKKIVHFSGSFSVFNSVEIAGGVNYFMYEKSHNAQCEFVENGNSRIRNLNEFDIIIQDNTQYDIVKKVRALNQKPINVFPSKPFGLRSDFSNWSNQGLKCVSVDRKEHYVSPNDFNDKHKILNKYKVVIGKANNDTNPNLFRVLAKPIVLNADEICTETFLVVGVFDTINEANNFASYVITKFFRFMVLAHKNTQNMCQDTFTFVPDVIDYTAPWTDKELYKKFNLTRQDIAYIESKIKAI